MSVDVPIWLEPPAKPSIEQIACQAEGRLRARGKWRTLIRRDVDFRVDLCDFSRSALEAPLAHRGLLHLVCAPFNGGKNHPWSCLGADREGV